MAMARPSPQRHFRGSWHTPSTRRIVTRRWSSVPFDLRLPQFLLAWNPQMELFGIAFSVPGAFVASAVYRSLLLIATARWPRIRPVFMFASYVVLAAILAEWAFLALQGAVGTRIIIGPGYYVGHLFVFFLGTPS